MELQATAFSLQDIEEAHPTYEVACADCGGEFDAVHAAWCSCLVSERSVVCPRCGGCFCGASWAYKRLFWSRAPSAMWDAKLREHALASGPAPNPSPDQARRPLVLVADDEVAILRLAARVVESLGYGVVTARNGLDGLALARQYLPELVLADALMPYLDGRDMCRQIKADPTTRLTKVVVMTALFTALRYQKEARREYGADEFLRKPVDPGRLRAVLVKHAGRRSSLAPVAGEV